VNECIEEARATAEEEKNILAAIMAELPEGVLICNNDGRILLYNKQARRFLARASNKVRKQRGRTIGLFGLGRIIFGLMDKSLVVHAIEEVEEKLAGKRGGKRDRLFRPFGRRWQAAEG
jgi:DNA polymerase-3 subunit epsilon